MPVNYYIIPQTAGPYSVSNPQMPMYVDEIQCNWSGHPVPGFDFFICKVNTLDAKHNDLIGRPGVYQMPKGYYWDTVISTIAAVGRNYISAWCSINGFPYDETETIGQFLMRIINTGLFELGSTPLNTPFSSLTSQQRVLIVASCLRWDIPTPNESETIREITDRCGPVWWNGDSIFVEEY